MTMKTEPFLSGKWGWDLGENNWKSGADENFLKFSYLLNSNVDGFVSSLPASPVNGTAYFLTTDNTLNARVDGVWSKYSVPKGFTVTDKATGDKYEFNGSSFVAAPNAADKVKLNGIATGATANDTNANLRDRATHTGTQVISTVTGLQTSLNTKAPSDSPTFTGNAVAPTAPVGDNSTKVATTAFVKSQNYLTAASAGVVSSVAGKTGDVLLVKADVGLSDVDNTPDSSKPVSTAQQTALNLKASSASPTFTGTVVLPTNTSVGTVTSTQISYLSGVTSNIQGQINSLSGSSGAYAPINNPTFTGTVNGITKAMVGLGNVDNTSDISKPISTATQTALNSKQPFLSGTGFVKSTGGTISYDNTSYAPLASPTFTGTVVLPSTTSIGSVSSTQLSYLVNSTSDIQVQLNSKAPINNPTFTGTLTATDASGLAGLSASNISTGILSAARLPFSYGTATIANYVVQRDTSGNISSDNFFSGLSSNVGLLDRGFRITNASTYNYGIGVGSFGGIEYHANQTGAGDHRWYTGSYGSPVWRMTLTNSGALSVNGIVQAVAGGGFVSDTYISNDRNPIWRFGNALSNGISYFHGTSGNSNQDTIGFHFGTATSSGSPFKFRADGRLYANAFEGDGAYLSALNASNISVGTLSDSRLSSNVALISNTVTKATPSQLFQNLGNVSGTVNVNGASGIHVLLTVVGTMTLVLPSPASNEVIAVTVEITNGGSATFNHPSGVRWAGGLQPTLTVSGTDIVVYTKAGTNAWRGYLSSKDNK